MRSLLSKLLASSFLIILLPIGLALLWTSSTMTELLERRFVETSQAEAEQVKVLLTEKQETATGLVHWIAEMPGVRETLKANDRAGLFQHLLPLVGSIEMDFIEIIGQHGDIFLRVHDPSNFGDRPPLAKDIQALLQGLRDLPNYGIEERDGRAYLRAAESIQGEKSLGIVSAGYAINHDFIKKLEQVAGGKVEVAIGNRLYTAGGPEITRREIFKRLTEEASLEEHFWHRGRLDPSLEIRLPLETDRGREGTLLLFFPSDQLSAAIRALQRNLFFVAIVGVILAFFVSWILSRRLTKPLKELVRGTEEVASGNFAADVAADSRDEIGMLASSFNRMLDELRRSKAEVEKYREQLERKFFERGKELAMTEQKRATMVHMIAHDLKNPLLGIKKTVESLTQTSPADEDQRQRTLRDLLSAGDLVIGMVNEMLDLYRSDFGDLPLSPTRFSLEEPLRTGLRILGPELEEKKLEVISRSEPSEIIVTADKRRLTRLLINVLSNAIKFSASNGRIYISTEKTKSNGNDAQILLRIEDEGVGISESDLSRIFDRFYSRDFGSLERGTGLGLHYCKLVAEAHHGKIWAENRRGGGFAVTLSLPNDSETERREAYGA